jgi:hypothetical protein
VTTWGNTIRKGALAILILTSFTTGAQGQGPGGLPGSFGGSLKSMTQITGTVVCAGCSLDEARKAHPELHDLYQLEHEQGQAVMQVN